MFITKKHLERRTFLRGMGAAVALPLLDAMIPARTALAQTAANPTPHMGFIYFPHGAIMEHWTPKTEGTDFDLPTILKPLAPFQKQLTVVSGLENKPAISPAVHAITPGTWLSCVHPRASQDPFGGPTIDQIAAAAHRTGHAPAVARSRHRRPRRRRFLRSRFRLQLLRHHLVPHAHNAAAHGNRAAQAVPAAVRPGRHRGGAQENLGKQYASILDLVSTEATDLQRTLGPQDRAMLSDYLDTVREIERRVEKMEAHDLSHVNVPNAPAGTPPQFRTAHQSDVRPDRAGLSGQHDAGLQHA